MLLLPTKRDVSIAVSHVVICAGDDVPHDAARGIDPHVGWRVNKATDGTLSYSPLTMRPGQQVWRGIGALLAFTDSMQRAGVLSWLASLEDRVQQVSLLVTACTFGDMSSTIKDVLSDSLDTPIAVLRAESPAAYVVARDAVDVAVSISQALGLLAESPLATFNSETGRFEVPVGKKDRSAKVRGATAEDFLFMLDAPFRYFLTTLGDTRSFDRARQHWSETIRDHANRAKRRIVLGWTTVDVLAGAQAEGKFQRTMSKILREFAPSNDDGKEGRQ
jgi:hypothetical protein